MGKSSPGPSLPLPVSAVHLALEENQMSSMTCLLTVISVVLDGKETTVSGEKETTEELHTWFKVLNPCVLYFTGSCNLPRRELW